MTHQYLQLFEPMVDFLADFLGENAEVVLHDFSDFEHSIVKIRNGNITGRKIGDPTTDFAIKAIKEAESKSETYRCNYYGMTKDGKHLKSATYNIRDIEGSVIGMLCINLDVDYYLQVRDYLDRFFMTRGTGVAKEAASVPHHDVNENFGKSIHDLIETSINSAISSYNCEVNRLNNTEKEAIIEQVNQEGIFLLKGSVSKAAQMLNISEPTVYRYLGKIKNQQA